MNSVSAISKVNNMGSVKKSFFHAFSVTLPIMAGFLFLGATYGIYMNVLGFSFIYPMLMSMTIYAGSVEFVVANILTGSFDPLHTFITVLAVNARHLFYGISMLEKYGDTGAFKPYLIFGMCDETFSVNYSDEVPDGASKKWSMFFVTLLDQLYWVAGATLGGIFGSLLSFDTKGLDFVMTAMFTVIFLEQWLKEKDHTASVIGIVAPALCLVVLGAEKFMIPSLVLLLVLLTALKKPIERGGRLA